MIAQLPHIWRYGAEFIRGFKTFRGIGPAVTVFGSAKFAQDHRWCEAARRTGHLLGENGFTVVTGGGPGIMEAASRGVKEGGGRAIGANIIVPFEQRPNPYLDRYVTFEFFPVRKYMLLHYSLGFVIFPGGYGTLDELYETVTLIRTNKLPRVPILLYGAEYWKGHLDWLREVALPEGTIHGADYELLQLVDQPEEVLNVLPRGR